MQDTSGKGNLPGVYEVAQALLDEFGDQLGGARQVTSWQMVEFLGRKYGLSAPQAEAIFSRLREAGVVTDADDIALPTLDGRRQQWEISMGAAASHPVAESTFADLETEIDVGPDELTPAVDLLRRAIEHRATDIHLDPFSDEYEVRFRIDGRLEHYCRLSQEIAVNLTNQFKIMAGLDIADPFHPKEGRLQLPMALSDYEVRFTSTPVSGGEAHALRLLHHRRLLRPLASLGLSDGALASVRELLQLGEGIVLVTGPTGAGKTTTVYSMVHALDNGHRNIVTIEDPVECRVPSFLQMEVDPRHQMTTARGLRTLLRMDPDVVMLGEIRGPDTADAAMRAASSGKYVFSTFHTRDVASTVTALRDLHVDSRSMAGNLRGLISQRLVRRLCRQCCRLQPIEPPEEAIFQGHGLDPPAEIAIPVGCESCRGTGYFERIGVFEVEANNPAVASAIEHGAPEDELRNMLRESGSVTLAEDALDKVRQGITSLTEAMTMTWVSFAAVSSPE
jgi:general secretion pathway protein E